MKIIDKSTGNHQFGTLAKAQVFRLDREGPVFMKTSGYDYFTAVRLDDGCLTYIGPGRTVYPVHAELVVS